MRLRNDRKLTSAESIFGCVENDNHRNVSHLTD
jgi:hypothetical protein